MVKKILSFIYWALIVVLIVIASSVVLSALDTPLGFKLYVVQSGSMEPTIKTGSIVAVTKEVKYSVGDIVTYQSGVGGRESVTHRLVSIKNDKGQTIYSTKGDANNSPDLKSVTEKQILGKVIYWVPYLGYAIAFSKTQAGFILLVIIPATIIVYSELMNIKNETKRLLEERKRRKLSFKEKVEEKIGEEIIAVEKGLGGVK